MTSGHPDIRLEASRTSKIKSVPMMTSKRLGLPILLMKSM